MRNWKQYSRYARDGEKTVYCQKGKHSVYYGDAVISFKPSKLIWCNECKETYYRVNETLFENQFTEEVTTMECDKNPLKRIKHHTWRSDYMPDSSIKEYCKWCGVNKKDLTTTTNPEEGMTMEKEQTFRPMTNKQVAYIRDLFAYNKEYMTIDEQESLVNKMKGHLDGSAVLSIVWAGKAIDKLKTYRDHTKWFSLLNYYAKGLHLNEELKIVPIEKGEEQ